MKNGRIRIILGYLLIVVQIISIICLGITDTKLWNDADDTFSNASTSRSGLNFAEWYSGFAIGNEKFFNSFGNLAYSTDSYAYRALTLREHLSIIIRESLGAGSIDSDPMLVFFDFNILIGYLFYGLIGLGILVSGYKARANPMPVQSGLDIIDSSKDKFYKTFIIILSIAFGILSIITDSIGGGGVFFPYVKAICFVMMTVFFIRYLGKEESILFPTAVILFAVDSILYLFNTMSNFFTTDMDLEIYAFPLTVISILSLLVGLVYLICGIKLYKDAPKQSLKKLSIVGLLFAILESLIWPLLLYMVYDPSFIWWIDPFDLAFSLIATLYIMKIPCEEKAVDDLELLDYVMDLMEGEAENLTVDTDTENASGKGTETKEESEDVSEENLLFAENVGHSC